VRSTRSHEQLLSSNGKGEEGKGQMCTTASTCQDGNTNVGRKKGERKGDRIGSRGRKRSYDHAFLVASIHVSSVTRVMSVGNTRFLESNGAVFSFYSPFFPSFSFPSLSSCPTDYLVLFIIVCRRIYVHGK